MLNNSALGKVIVFVALSIFTATSAARTEHAKIVFATDMPEIEHQKRGGYPELASVLEKYRQQSSPTFFIFGGGSLGPSPMSSFDRGSHIIDILNSLEPDMMAAGKREFSYFEDELSLRSYEAAFPIVISNLYDTLTQGNLDGLYSTTIIKKNNYKIGVLAFIDQSVVEEYLLQRADIFSPCKVISKLSKKLRAQGVDLVIMVYDTAQNCYMDALQQREIDLSIGTNTRSDQSLSGKFIEHSRNVGVIEQGHAVVIDLNWEKDMPASLTITKEDITLPKFAKEPDVFLQVQGYTKRLDRLLNQVIGFIQSSIDTARNTVRTREAEFGNFVADTIKDYGNADIALINGGAIRGEKYYLKGSQLTRRDIAEELPFRTRITVLKITGQQLLDGLENGFSGIETSEGRFPQISGMAITYDPDAPTGQRVIDVKIAGKPLVLEQYYDLATSDYLASGGDGYKSFVEAEEISYSNHISPLLSDVVIRAVQKKKNISPKIEFRITRVKHI
ncbi:MAG: 5'-nucleotidase/UDP-sugar diphosphatase [Paraglaciecola sp.]|jgi:5'-nucleotidase/UDP-sugar diphosphatase